MFPATQTVSSITITLDTGYSYTFSSTSDKKFKDLQTNIGNMIRRKQPDKLMCIYNQVERFRLTSPYKEVYDLVAPSLSFFPSQSLPTPLITITTPLAHTAMNTEPLVPTFESVRQLVQVSGFVNTSTLVLPSTLTQPQTLCLPSFVKTEMKVAVKKESELLPTPILNDTSASSTTMLHLPTLDSILAQQKKEAVKMLTTKQDIQLPPVIMEKEIVEIHGETPKLTPLPVLMPMSAMAATTMAFGSMSSPSVASIPAQGEVKIDKLALEAEQKDDTASQQQANRQTDLVTLALKKEDVKIDTELTVPQQVDVTAAHMLLVKKEAEKKRELKEEDELPELFENDLAAEEKIPLPLFSATRSLNVKYFFRGEKEHSTVKVPATNIHSMLCAGVDDKTGLLAKRKTLYSKDIDNVNFSTAALTLLYTDTTTQEGYLVAPKQKHFFLTGLSPTDYGGYNWRILSVTDFYDKLETNAKRSDPDQFSAPGVTKVMSRRSHKFNNSLIQRVTAFSELVGKKYYLEGKVLLPNHLQDKPKPSTKDKAHSGIYGSQFQGHFHHSEQAEMHLLSSYEGIKSIVKAAEACPNIAYLYGIVLDIYTQRMVCHNCNASLLGMENSQENGFLADLTQALKKSEYKIQTRDKLMLSTRISASQDGNGTSLSDLKVKDEADCWHNYDPDQIVKVYQANIDAVGSKKNIGQKIYSLDTFKGSFFTSTQIGGDKSIKLEKAISNVDRRTLPTFEP